MTQQEKDQLIEEFRNKFVANYIRKYIGGSWENEKMYYRLGGKKQPKGIAHPTPMFTIENAEAFLIEKVEEAEKRGAKTLIKNLEDQMDNAADTCLSSGGMIGCDMANDLQLVLKFINSQNHDKNK